MNKTTLLSSTQILDIFSASHIATAIYTTSNLVIEAATDAMLAFWDKDRAIIGMCLADAVPELKEQQFIAQLQSVFQTGETITGKGVPAELLNQGKLQVKYYDYEYRALKNEAGITYCILHTATDVTERELGLQATIKEQQQSITLANEQALNEELASAIEELSATNEELELTQNNLRELNQLLEDKVAKRTAEVLANAANLRYMIDDAPVAIAVLKGDGFIVEQANRYILKIWGKTDSIIGGNIYDALPEIEGQGFFELLKQVYESGEAFAGTEAPGYMKYGGELIKIYTNFVFKPLKDKHGNTHSILIVATEVSEQVHNRMATEAAKHRLEAMVHNTPVAMTILKGTDLLVEIANQPMLNVWRRTREQVIGKGLVEIFPELKDQPNPGRMRGVLETGKRFALPETPVMLADVDGTLKTHYANFSYDPIFEADGSIASILVTVVDITDAVKNRTDLEQSREHLQETSEELAASNEELSSINEEMMASNEELASTNEELVATQEQLQSLISRLKESEERFRFLLNAIPQQVWTATSDGALDYVNDVVCHDFGYNHTEIVGYGWQKFIHPDDLPNALKRWVLALETGGEYLTEFRLMMNNGEYRWHLARAIPLIERDQIALWLGTNTNIHLQKTNEQKKDEFLSIASHELKTPLTSIKAFNQLMKRTQDTSRLSGFVSKSAEHIYRLEKLIADLLDVTRLNAGKLDYNMQPFSLSAMISDSVDNIRHLASTHEIVLQDNVDIEITGDQFRLEQVLNNLLSNAVKYSPGGKKVIVSSKLENNQVTISVQDFGIGIDQAHIDRLFDRYYRVDNTAMRFEGLGLGLFISSEILNRHNGRFQIKSQPGQGSTFYFSLPVVE